MTPGPGQLGQGDNGDSGPESLEEVVAGWALGWLVCSWVSCVLFLGIS